MQGGQDEHSQQWLGGDAGEWFVTMGGHEAREGEAGVGGDESLGASRDVHFDLFLPEGQLLLEFVLFGEIP